MSTPFSRWSENGQPDPHRNDFNGPRKFIAGGKMSDAEVAEDLKRFSFSITRIAATTIAKERLRWLSRALLSALESQGIDKSGFCKVRASMSMGDLTDDELANAFFLDERTENLYAGAERIMWLSGLLEKLTAYNSGEYR